MFKKQFIKLKKYIKFLFYEHYEAIILALVFMFAALSYLLKN